MRPGGRGQRPRRPGGCSTCVCELVHGPTCVFGDRTQADHCTDHASCDCQPRRLWAMKCLNSTGLAWPSCQQRRHVGTGVGVPLPPPGTTPGARLFLRVTVAPRRSESHMCPRTCASKYKDRTATLGPLESAAARLLRGASPSTGRRPPGKRLPLRAAPPLWLPRADLLGIGAPGQCKAALSALLATTRC